MNQVLQYYLSLFKKHPFKWGGVGMLILILMISVYFRLQTKPSSPSVKLLTPSFIQPSNVPHPEHVEISDNSLKLESEIAEYSTVGTPPSRFLIQTAQNLNLQPTAHIQNLYQDTEKNTSISSVGSDGSLQYTNSATLPTTSIITKDQAIAFANDFFRSIKFPTTFIDTSAPDFVYLVPDNEVGSTSQTSTNTMLLHYFIQIGSVPIGIDKQTSQPIQLYVSSLGVFKAVVPPYTFSVDQKANTTSLSLDEIKKNIQNGNYVFLGENSQPSLSSNTSFSFSKATLEYRFDSNQNTLLPFLHLVGSATSSTTTQSQTVEIITPAIPTVSPSQ